MKIAVLGGAFNPLHIGHCMLAESVVKDLGYERVLFVPTNIPPHKKMASDVSGKIRLEMVQRFCDEASAHGAKAFFYESCEIDRAGISYTTTPFAIFRKNTRKSCLEKSVLYLARKAPLSFSGGTRLKKSQVWSIFLSQDGIPMETVLMSTLLKTRL